MQGSYATHAPRCAHMPQFLTLGPFQTLVLSLTLSAHMPLVVPRLCGEHMVRLGEEFPDLGWLGWGLGVSVGVRVRVRVRVRLGEEFPDLVRG